MDPNTMDSFAEEATIAFLNTFPGDLLLEVLENIFTGSESIEDAIYSARERRLHFACIKDSINAYEKCNRIAFKEQMCCAKVSKVSKKIVLPWTAEELAIIFLTLALLIMIHIIGKLNYILTSRGCY
ncbi:hypothetical protein EDB81DRAFT_760933 [Dactylonectria macrodidyma]|uniref:Uncharacterized protein n=1 Tax=Dactylonectria macrodidyma TaxID=307937 RepID=A0A9P9J5P8_9HYPO|nr:hypothetical protein EDB81DRAFT_760933 [Dactylonectria macrodidyma]